MPTMVNKTSQQITVRNQTMVGECVVLRTCAVGVCRLL